LVTNDPAIAEKVRMLRNHGQREKYYHLLRGGNRRLDSIQAAALRIKLKHLDQWNASRRRAASIYDRLLRDCPGVIAPLASKNVEHVYHLYVIRHERRDEMMTWLSERGVATGLHYPVPVHLQPSYEELGMKSGSLPVSEEVAATLLSLPMYSGITDEQVEYVAEAVSRFVAG
jgi:dTDP-4-amino-4,6-dideoxygalactose transaminase